MDAGPEGKDEHEDGGKHREGQVFHEEAQGVDILIEEGLGDAADDAGDLCTGFDLSQHIRGDDDALRARNDEADGRDGELTEDHDHDRPEEDIGKELVEGHTCHGAVEDHEHSTDDHKLIRQWVEKLTEIGNEVIPSRDLAVEHIGKGGDDEEDKSHNACPDRL